MSGLTVSTDDTMTDDDDPPDPVYGEAAQALDDAAVGKCEPIDFDPCPKGCGRTTDDAYGGPCSACWAAT